MPGDEEDENAVDCTIPGTLDRSLPPDDECKLDCCNSRDDDMESTSAD